MIYTILGDPHEHPLPDDESNGTGFNSLTVIPEGLAVWAAAFAPFWLAWHRLWFALLIWCGLMAIGLTLMSMTYSPIMLYLNALPGFYLLLEGHQLRRNKLYAQGYELLGVVDAPRRRYALEKFLYEWQPAKAQPKPIRKFARSETSGDEIGLFPVNET